MVQRTRAGRADGPSANVSSARPTSVKPAPASTAQPVSTIVNAKVGDQDIHVAQRGTLAREAREPLATA